MVTVKLGLDPVVNYCLLISTTPKAPKWRRHHLNKPSTWVYIRAHTHLPLKPPMYNYPVCKRKTRWLYNYQMWTKKSCPFKSLATFPSHTLPTSEQTPKQYNACCLESLMAQTNVKSTCWRPKQLSVMLRVAGGVGEGRGLEGVDFLFFIPTCPCELYLQKENITISCSQLVFSTSVSVYCQLP